MKVVLITTCVIDPHRLDLLSRMLESVAHETVRLSQDSDIETYILLQNCEITPVNANASQKTKIFTDSGVMPLSVARNKLLLIATQDANFNSDTIVAFPDDDCWYTDEIINFVIDSFKRNKSLGFVFCRYDATPVKCTAVGKENFKRANLSCVIRNASSNTMFLRGDIISKIGFFDENLGVGTPVGGSEDLDFAIKAFFSSIESYYFDAAVIGHRSKSNVYRGRYYRSTLIVLARHICCGTLWELFRKVLIGVYLILHKQLTVSSYILTLRDGFIEAVRPVKRKLLGANHA